MQSVTRIAYVLRAVAAGGQRGVRLADVARATDLSPAVCQRLAEALEREGVLQRDVQTRRYRLGLDLLRLSANVAPVGGFGPDVERELAALRTRWSEASFMGILVDGHVVLLAASPLEPVSVERHLGYRVPLHAAAAGKAILAHLPEDHARRLLSRGPLERLTRHTHGDVESVMRDLEATRERGFAICDEETDLGVVAYAAPVMSSPGEPPRSLGIVGSRARMLANLRDGLLDDLLTAAEAVSAPHAAAAMSAIAH